MFSDCFFVSGWSFEACDEYSVGSMLCKLKPPEKPYVGATVAHTHPPSMMGHRATAPQK